MEVVSTNLDNVHVGGQVTEMSIKQSAHIMSMLSNLYSDPEMAALRETLTNAHDIHVLTGQTKPIEITVEGDTDFINVTIKDYGTGISPDKIHETFGTFGGTTKSNQENQTGGFGIGCKAPMAICTVFTIKSAFEGVSTLYRMVRNSNTVGGSYGIAQISQIPTEDTGITVSYTYLAGKRTVASVVHLARTLVKQGNMVATVNGKLVKNYGRLDFEGVQFKTKIGFDKSNSKPELVVKYGAMVYRLNTYTKSVATLLENFAETAFGCLTIFRDVYNVSREILNTFVLYVEMEPGTLTIPPSRETLIFNEYTVNALSEVLEKAAQQIRKEFSDRFLRIYQTTDILHEIGMNSLSIERYPRKNCDFHTGDDLLEIKHIVDFVLSEISFSSTAGDPLKSTWFIQTLRGYHPNICLNANYPFMYIKHWKVADKDLAKHIELLQKDIEKALFQIDPVFDWNSPNLVYSFRVLLEQVFYLWQKESKITSKTFTPYLRHGSWAGKLESDKPRIIVSSYAKDILEEVGVGVRLAKKDVPAFKKYMEDRGYPFTVFGGKYLQMLEEAKNNAEKPNGRTLAKECISIGQVCQHYRLRLNFYGAWCISEQKVLNAAKSFYTPEGYGTTPISMVKYYMTVEDFDNFGRMIYALDCRTDFEYSIVNIVTQFIDFRDIAIIRKTGLKHLPKDAERILPLIHEKIEEFFLDDETVNWYVNDYLPFTAVDLHPNRFENNDPTMRELLTPFPEKYKSLRLWAEDRDLGRVCLVKSLRGHESQSVSGLQEYYRAKAQSLRTMNSTIYNRRYEAKRNSLDHALSLVKKVQGLLYLRTDISSKEMSLINELVEEASKNV